MEAKDYYLFIIILQIVGVFISPYITRKWINAAEKEDLRELTKEVEAVKDEFANSRAKIQSELDVLKDRKQKNYTQAQQAIINFYTDYHNWEFLILTISHQYDEQNYSQINILRADIRKQVEKIRLSRALVGLLVDEEILRVSSYDLIGDVILWWEAVDIYFKEYAELLQKKANIHQIFNLQSWETKEPAEQNALFEALAKTDRELIKTWSEYEHITMKNFDSIRGHLKIFRDVAKAYILN